MAASYLAITSWPRGVATHPLACRPHRNDERLALAEQVPERVHAGHAVLGQHVAGQLDGRDVQAKDLRADNVTVASDVVVDAGDELLEGEHSRGPAGCSLRAIYGASERALRCLIGPDLPGQPCKAEGQTMSNHESRANIWQQRLIVRLRRTDSN